MTSKVLRGDCRAVMRTLAPDSVDAIVTDPPYHLTSIVKRFANAKPETEAFALNNDHRGFKSLSRGFMGQTWDGGGVAFEPETWAEALRVLKPGGHLLAFSGSRTYHRMVCAIEDAGFEVRDQIMWVYGSGFPKSHDASKGIDEHFFNGWLDSHPIEREQYREQMRQAGSDTKAREHVKRKFRKAAGAEREVVSTEKVRDIRNGHGRGLGDGINAANRDAPVYMERNLTAPATDAAREWSGWGTALKPAWEPICMARKPLSEKTVAANVLRWGTGAINVDGCRVGTEKTVTLSGPGKFTKNAYANGNGWDAPISGKIEHAVAGRWPANLIHDGSDEVLAAFPETTSGDLKPYRENHENRTSFGFDRDKTYTKAGDSGSAARFFYCAKSSRADRNAGLPEGERSTHPTVKPTALMRYLCRLVTPPGGTVLDPFMGSGSTGRGAALEGFDFIGIEQDEAYAKIARLRIADAQREARREAKTPKQLTLRNAA